MTSSSRESLVEVLRREILGAGKSVFAVAKEARVSQPILSRFLSGKRGITLQTAERLCRTLGLELRRSGTVEGPHAPAHFFAVPSSSGEAVAR
ncbi:MAG TPA: helix-turn-helix domain-containing protein [Gemmataceae bacterium]|nr:helix-turn-helix domain-containing protein [Gemmataceae bacterium]